MNLSEIESELRKALITAKNNGKLIIRLSFGDRIHTVCAISSLPLNFNNTSFSTAVSHYLGIDQVQFWSLVDGWDGKPFESYGAIEFWNLGRKLSLEFFPKSHWSHK